MKNEFLIMKHRSLSGVNSTANYSPSPMAGDINRPFALGVRSNYCEASLPSVLIPLHIKEKDTDLPSIINIITYGGRHRAGPAAQMKINISALIKMYTYIEEKYIMHFHLFAHVMSWFIFCSAIW